MTHAISFVRKRFVLTHGDTKARRRWRPDSALATSTVFEGDADRAHV